MNARQFVIAVKKLSSVLRGYASSGLRKSNISWPDVYVDFHNPAIFRRYQFLVTYCLSKLPANIVWRFRAKNLVTCIEDGQLLWWRQEFYRFDFFGSYLRGKTPLMVVTDSPEIYATCNNLRIVEFANVGNEVVVDCEADFELPYFGAPNFLFNAAETEGILPQSEDQLNRRRYSVCFAGNCDPSQYLSSKELDRLGVMSRVRAKEIIQNAFAPITLNIEKWSDKEKLTLPHTQSIVLSNSYKAGLNFTEYRRLLLKSNFFLALPGLSSPYTHSLYESLSCQCVPILPRSNLTAAGWVHGKNCLLFHDPKSLIECMRIALAADESSIRELRKNAAALFREKYDIETTASRLINSERSRIAFRNV